MICMRQDTLLSLHTSKRMHFIEEVQATATATMIDGLHTSKRMHFIEDL
ncbi:hypothetical protein APC1472_1381 [Bifidobacterium longum]|nr:hypothetical protein APC1472_1381 [Bifidobacterium longum]